MADRSVREILLHCLQKEQRRRLINRLIAYVFCCIGMYLFLLLGLTVVNLPLIVFHFLLFTCFSLLPLFLILGPEAERTVAVLRRLDLHCQAETYLKTPSNEHRAFLEPRVKNLLDRPGAVKMLRFRLAKTNLFLAIGVLCLFAVLQLASLATFQRLTPGLNAQAMKNLRTHSEAADRREGKEAKGTRWALHREQTQSGAPDTASSKQVSPSGGSSGETKAKDTDLVRRESDQGPPGTERAVPPTGKQTDGGAAESLPWVPVPTQEGGVGLALKGALEQGPEPEARRGELPAGSGEAGRALMDSPLQEYSASSLQDRIQSEGGTKLTAENSPGSIKEQPFIQSLFADFPFLASGEVGFDPAIERISRRYLELLNEQY